MKLTYTWDPEDDGSAVRFHELGTYLRCVDERHVGEPAEAPKRWRCLRTFEVDCTEETFADNRGLIDQLRAALNSQEGVLLWEDDKGTKYLERTVRILEHNLPSEDAQLRRGTFWQQIRFTVAYEDHTLAGRMHEATYRRTGSTGPAIHLGDIDDFRDTYNTELMNRMRGIAEYIGGRVSVQGVIKADTTKTLEQRRADLRTAYAQLKRELVRGREGRLIYANHTLLAEQPGSALFDEVIRVVDFSPRLDLTHNRIEYSLSGTFTRYPNELDYAVATYRVQRVKRHEDGSDRMVISGRIGAPTEVLARARLAQIRTGATAGGLWVLANEEGEPEIISSHQNSGAAAEPQGDGEAFVQLSFTDTYLKHTGGIVRWAVNLQTSDSAQAGYLRLTKSGEVLAFGVNLNEAYLAGVEKVQELAANPGVYPLSSSITFASRQYHTDGKVFVPLQFSYEYLTRSSAVHHEVTGVRQENRFGDTVEVISGTIQAPTLAVAEDEYDSLKHALAGTALLLEERRPTHRYQATGGITLGGPFDFSFTVHRDKTSASVLYRVTPEEDVVNMTVITRVSGTCWAATEAAANTAVNNLITNLGSIGQRVRRARTPTRRQGRNVDGNADVTAFFGLDFDEVYERALTGINGVLQSECSETLRYSGARNIEKPIVDGVSVIQRTGTSAGRRTVQFTVRATTEQGCQAFASLARARLLVGDGTNVQYEDPPEITKRFKFPGRVSGVPRGDGANCCYFEWSGQFSEIVVSLPAPK